MPRNKEINKLLGKNLAFLISKENLLKKGLITVSYVDCSPDLKSAVVGISVLPDNLKITALKKLSKNSKKFSNILKKQIRIRKIPKFKWIFDPTEKNAQELEKIFEKIKKDS